VLNFCHSQRRFVVEDPAFGMLMDAMSASDGGTSEPGNDELESLEKSFHIKITLPITEPPKSSEPKNCPNSRDLSYCHVMNRGALEVIPNFPPLYFKLSSLYLSQPMKTLISTLYQTMTATYF